MEGKQEVVSLSEKIGEINRKISQALSRSNNPVREVKLIAVSKTFPAEKIAEAMDTGLLRFGENRVREIVSKYEQLKERNPEWHFIGYLQTNKVKKLLGVPTRCIHSVDRLELAIEFERQLQKRGEQRDVLVEVNTSGESSKSGVEPEKAIALLRDLRKLETIRVKGLMTISALTEDMNEVRKCFKKLREIFLKAQQEAVEGVEMSELSMGMSGDFEIAVEEGATMIRIGSAIFGERRTPA